jgi:putative Holliday junction resolvase
MISTKAADFRDALPSGGRLIGLDVGTKTIGVAFCDAQWTFALITAQNIAGIVVGLPLNLDGSESPRSQSTRAFARNLQSLDLPILLWDERWSTQAVTRTLIDADTTRARRAELVDKMAAAYILQGAIDALTMG